MKSPSQLRGVLAMSSNGHCLPGWLAMAVAGCLICAKWLQNSYSFNCPHKHKITLTWCIMSNLGEYLHISKKKDMHHSMDSDMYKIPYICQGAKLEKIAFVIAVHLTLIGKSVTR